MAYGKSKDLVKRTQSNKVLKDKAFKIASDPKYDGYQRGLVSMVYKVVDKNVKGSGIATLLANRSANEPNYQLVNELHKPVIRKFKQRRVYSSFRNNIWGVELADMQSLSKYNKGIKYLLCVMDLFSKYAWVILIKDKKGNSIVNAFKKIISKRRKPNKTWVDQGSECYKNSFKDFWKKKNNIEMYSTYNKRKSVVAKRFIRTLKNKIFKHMTAISKNIYFDVIDDIVNKYNNTVHKTIEMKPIDVTDDSYAECNENFNKKDPKFKVGDNARISKYKNILAKAYNPNRSEEIFVVSKIKNTFPWTYVVSDLNGEELLEVFMKKNCKKLVKKALKGDKLYVNGKGIIIVSIVGLIKKVSYMSKRH